MKHTAGLSIIIAISIFLSIIPSHAQIQPNRHQGYIIWEDLVYPSKADAYEETTREQMALYAEAGFPYRVDVYQMTEFVYYWVFEIDNYADIDRLYQEFNQIHLENPDWVEALAAGYAGTHESTISWTCYSDPDLSYKPRGLQHPDPESPYLQMGFCYPVKGKMQQAREAMKGFVDLASEKQAILGWDTFIGDLGVDAPLIIWASYAKDPQEYVRLNAADFDLMGADADERWKTLKGVMRKYEEKTGWYREDLSYTPE